MNERKLHPDALRIVLRELVKQARNRGLTQKNIAAAVGQREDSFSKMLSGTEGYDIDTPLLVNVLNVIGEDFATFAELVEKENRKLQAGSR